MKPLTSQLPLPRPLTTTGLLSFSVVDISCQWSCTICKSLNYYWACCLLGKSLDLDLFVWRAFFFFFLSFVFLVPYPWHMEVPRLGPVRTVATSLHHSHSNARSEMHLRPTPQQHRTFNPLSKARGWTCVLMDASRIRYHCATTELPCAEYFYHRCFYPHVGCLFNSVIWLKWEPLSDGFSEQTWCILLAQLLS